MPTTGLRGSHPTGKELCKSCVDSDGHLEEAVYGFKESLQVPSVLANWPSLNVVY
jgi:hypothetical protein